METRGDLGRLWRLVEMHINTEILGETNRDQETKETRETVETHEDAHQYRNKYRQEIPGRVY